MKLINLFYLVVVLSLVHSQSQAQSLSPTYTSNQFSNTNNTQHVFNEMFWRNLYPFSLENSLNLVFNQNKSQLNHYSLDSKGLNISFKLTPNCINSENLLQCSHLSHFKQSINNIAKEVKRHQLTSQPKKELEYHDNLMNIYPNPLYNQAIVKFEIPKSGFGKLSVFDLTGKEVHNIAIGYFDKGNFEERLSRKDLSKGTYLVRLSVENYIETKKLIVAR
ncbi:MAG: T9SS type A sorting domain-containing protein [Saprospiraceae bacterium]